jgi:hypothetical protein
MKTSRNVSRQRAMQLLLCLLGAVLASHVARAQEAAPVATVTVQTQQLGVQIPKDFVGLSLEVSTAGQGITAFASGTAPPVKSPATAYALGTADAPNEAFFHSMHNLGPGILRLGGNSQDNTCWNPAAAPHPEWCKGVLTSADFQIYSRAAKDSGWRLIVGINLKQNSSEWALKEVTDAIAKAVNPSQTIGLELGNEPDLFSRDGSRPQTYSAADHVKDFLAYSNAFAQNPVARQYGVVGPATCCSWRNAKDLGTFVDGAGASNLKLVTVHNYPLTTCNGRTLTIQQLLAPEVISRFNGQMQGLAEAARERKVPIALAETNSASCGGMPGVSNAFAAALWGIDTLYSAAQDGLSGVNFHISYRPGGSSYNPIDTFAQASGSGRQSYGNVVEPLYYGMYLFAQNASGEYLLPADTQTGSNIRSYATTACSNCAIHVVVINADASAAGRIHVQVGNQSGKAELLLLKAPKLSSSSADVSYGGVQFDSEGHIPVPHEQQIQSDPSGNYEFDLPNASAAVLTVRPESR